MELYAIKYGEAPFALKYIYKDCAGSDALVPTDWLLYLAVVGDRTILVDTGFRNEEEAGDWGLTFTNYLSELDALLRGKPVHCGDYTRAF
jgi:hypothetical protein